MFGGIFEFTNFVKGSVVTRLR